MDTFLYAIYRNTSFNGNTLEVNQPFGYFHTDEEANEKAQVLQDSVLKNTALRGFSFTFYVKKISVA